MLAQSFWSRMGTWFKPASSRHDDGPGGPFHNDGPGGPSHTGGPSHNDGPGGRSHTALAEAVIAPTSILSKRELTLERLQEGYHKVVGLVESIQDHMERQDQRGESMSRAMSALAESMAPVGDTAREQLRVLCEMNAQLGQMPRIADAQREAVVAIGRHMDAAGKTNERMSGTLDGFHRAVTNLGDASNASTAALRQMHADAAAREERMAGVLRDQTRRFTWIASMAIAIAAISAAISAVVLLR